MGRHHGSQTCIGYRGYRCDCLHGLGPGGTPAFDPNDCDDFSWCAREKTFRRGGSFSYVLATVCKRHRHQVDSAMKASETALGRGINSATGGRVSKAAPLNHGKGACASGAAPPQPRVAQQ